MLTVVLDLLHRVGETETPLQRIEHHTAVQGEPEMNLITIEYHEISVQMIACLVSDVPELLVDESVDVVRQQHLEVLLLAIIVAAAIVQQDGSDEAHDLAGLRLAQQHFQRLVQRLLRGVPQLLDPGLLGAEAARIRILITGLPPKLYCI